MVGINPSRSFITSSISGLNAPMKREFVTLDQKIRPNYMKTTLISINKKERTPL